VEFTDYDTRLAAYAVIVDSDDRILLTWYNGRGGGRPGWALPGGGVEYAETVEAGLVREIREETGYEAELGPPMFVRTFTAPRGFRQRRPFKSVQVVQAATIRGGTLGTLETDGSTDYAVWMPLSEALATESRSDVVDAAVAALQQRQAGQGAGRARRAVTDIPPAVEIPEGDPQAIVLFAAVRSGDVGTLRRLLAEHPELARAVIADGKGGLRSLLHLVADWPGYFPSGPEIVRLVTEAGADPSFRHPDRCAETPLHWAASSDDADVAAALIDGGADLDAPGGSIGTPLANAVGYGCWQVARLLAARGARIGSLWEAAALGDRVRVDEFLTADPPPAGEDISEAFWQACHGGQRRMAEYLLGRGADVHASPGYAADQSALQAAGEAGTQREILSGWLKDQGLGP
jgi:ADP-ribose pyrophosphatase YjhB (NUDIX family)